MMTWCVISYLFPAAPISQLPLTFNSLSKSCSEEENPLCESGLSVSSSSTEMACYTKSNELKHVRNFSSKDINLRRVL